MEFTGVSPDGSGNIEIALSAEGSSPQDAFYSVTEIAEEGAAPTPEPIVTAKRRVLINVN